jgi:hypothetical protein
VNQERLSHNQAVAELEQRLSVHFRVDDLACPRKLMGIYLSLDLLNLSRGSQIENLGQS